MKLLTARQFLKKFNISKHTLYNWRKEGKVDFVKVGQKSYLYNPLINQTNEEQKLFIGYARVSNTKQKTDLDKQKQELNDFIVKNGNPSFIISDIASGMNEKRKGFNELLDLVFQNKVDTIYITYKDRLTRFGINYFEKIFSDHNVKLVVLNSDKVQSFQDELTQDLISIIHHFSMKMYSHRREILKNTKKELFSALKQEK